MTKEMTALENENFLGCLRRLADFLNLVDDKKVTLKKLRAEKEEAQTALCHMVSLCQDLKTIVGPDCTHVGRPESQEPKFPEC